MTRARAADLGARLARAPPMLGSAAIHCQMVFATTSAADMKGDLHHKRWHVHFPNDIDPAGRPYLGRQPRPPASLPRSRYWPGAERADDCWSHIGDIPPSGK